MAWGSISKRPTFGLWLVAGLPVIATVIQSILALIQMTSRGTPLEGIASVFHSMAVFQVAAVVFWQSPTIVFVLILLVAVFWLVQAWTMFVKPNRQLAAGSALLVSVLFFVLFFWVYAPLFSREISPAQLLLFFAAPTIASGSALVAAYVHPWGQQIADEALDELVAIENEAEQYRDMFEQAYRNRLGEIDQLGDFGAEIVERARQERDDFIEACESIMSEAHSLRVEELAESAGREEEIRRESRALRNQLADLDPEEALENIESGLRDDIADATRQRYSEFQIWSEFDRTYRLVNLPSKFREVYVTTFRTEIHLDHLAEDVPKRIQDEGTPIRNSVGAINEIESHLEQLANHIDQHEREFIDRKIAVEQELDDVEEKIDQFGGQVKSRLIDYVIEGRTDDFDSVSDVRHALKEARDSLHDCRFDEVERHATRAEEMAADLVRYVEFLRALEGTITHENASVTLPERIESGPIEDVKSSLEEEYGVKIEIEGDQLRLRYVDSSSDTGRSKIEPLEGQPDMDGDLDVDSDSGTETAPPEAVIDSVLYVIRELQQAASDDDGEIQFQTDELPSSVGQTAVLNRLERFGSHQSDVIESISVQDDAPPGYITVIPATGVTPSKAVSELHVRYLDRYG